MTHHQTMLLTISGVPDISRRMRGLIGIIEVMKHVLISIFKYLLSRYGEFSPSPEADDKALMDKKFLFN